MPVLTGSPLTERGHLSFVFQTGALSLTPPSLRSNFMAKKLFKRNRHQFVLTFNFKHSILQNHNDLIPFFLLILASSFNLPTFSFGSNSHWQYAHFFIIAKPIPFLL